MLLLAAKLKDSSMAGDGAVATDISLETCEPRIIMLMNGMNDLDLHK